MRRILTITLIVLVLAGAGVAAYVYFFMGSSGVAVAPNGSTSLPVAGEGTTPGSDTNTPPSEAIGTPSPVSARLVKISVGPVVPGEVLTATSVKNASSTPDTAVNYIERQSGNVFSYFVHTQSITRTSNRTVPGIQSAFWLPNASLAFVHYLSGTDFSTINTYALPQNGSGGFFLPQDLSDIAVASTSVLTLASGVNGSVGSLTHTDGTHATQIFTTPLSSLHISFAGKNQYLAYTKPSATLPGDAFLVDATGHFSRVAGPLTGLVALSSPSGKWILVSYVVNGAMQMELVNATTNEAISLPIATIADKCVWTANDASVYCGIPMDPSADASYPDDWYQGAVSFNDRIWKIDVASRYAQLVLDFNKETNTTLDAEALAIDPMNTTLVFVNKNDGSLWSYSL